MKLAIAILCTSIHIDSNNRNWQYLFQIVYLLDVATLGWLQLADVPVLISALLEERRWSNLVAAQHTPESKCAVTQAEMLCRMLL